MELLDLNEHCLLEIFSQKSLTLEDLRSLTQTCKRFKRLTRSVFRKEFEMKIGYYQRDYKFTSKNHAEIHESVEDVERILRNSGSNLYSLVIHRNDTAVNDLVAKYCGAGALKRLEIFTLKCTPDLKDKFGSIYQRLLVLSIRECSVEADVTVQQFNCESLIELNIVNVRFCSAILENNFPNLERLTFEQIGSDGRTFTYDRMRSDGRETLFGFIGRHTTLRTIVLNIDFENRIQTLVHSVANCKDLEELFLRNFYSSEGELDLNVLKGMTKLRTLDVDICDGSFSHLVSLLTVFKGLETFKFSNGGRFQINSWYFLHALAQLENLRKLGLTNCFFKPITKWTTKLRKLFLREHTDAYYGTHVIGLISRLTHLTELEIDVKRQGFLLSESTFYEIVETVERRSNGLTLRCKFDFSENILEQCNENRKVELIKLE